MTRGDVSVGDATNSNLTRRDFLGGAASAALAVGMGGLVGCQPRMLAGEPSTKRRLNFVIIYVDDLDFDELSPYCEPGWPSYTNAHRAGLLPKQNMPHFQNHVFLSDDEQSYFADANMLTPHLARLAERGVRMNHYYATSAVCTPSRYGLLTGRYASRSESFLQRHPPGEPACIAWDTQLGLNEPNLAKALRSVGYRTAMIGKWHLGENPAELYPWDQLLCVQRELAYQDPRDPAVACRIRNLYEAYRRSVLQGHGFDEVDRLYHNNKEGLALPKSLQVHNTAWVAQGAFDFIHRQKTDQPFFLYLALTAPHGQYYADWLLENELATSAGMLDERPADLPSKRDILRRVRAAGLDPRNAMATSIDDAVGAVVRALEATGRDRDTVVIVASDHQSRGKNCCYEGARVPCLIAGPGVAPRRGGLDALCANIDIAPTLLAMAGADPALLGQADGRDLSDLLAGRTPTDWRKHLLLEIGYTRAVVTPHHKYIVNRPSAQVLQRMQAEAAAASDRMQRRIDWAGNPNPHWGEPGVWFYASRDFPCYFDPDQLYDLDQDVFEQTNRYDDPSLAAIRKDLIAVMAQAGHSLPHRFGEF
ncbi:MAG: sulfatase family protein [Phycisphaerales bacterium]